MIILVRILGKVGGTVIAGLVDLHQHTTPLVQTLVGDDDDDDKDDDDNDDDTDDDDDDGDGGRALAYFTTGSDPD